MIPRFSAAKTPSLQKCKNPKGIKVGRKRQWLANAPHLVKAGKFIKAAGQSWSWSWDLGVAVVVVAPRSRGVVAVVAS